MTGDAPNTTGRLSLQPWMVAPATQKVMHSLLRDGGDARFVGGCVRDALANRRVIDVDIATPLLPDAVQERLAQDGIRAVPTGLAHGTVTAVAGDTAFEITTLREDVSTDGRHADVAFTGSWQADAARRDFTINAMSCTAEGAVHDYFGGMEDLRLGRVVFVGDAAARVKEDYLRILRFFRFYAHFGRGAPDDAARAACRDNLDGLARVSAERVRQEMLKLMDAPRCADAWDDMAKTGVTTALFGTAGNAAALARLVALEEKYNDGGFALRRLFAALTDAPADGNVDVTTRLRLSGDEARQWRLWQSPPVEVHPAMTRGDIERAVYRLGNDAVISLLLLRAARAGGDKNSCAPHDKNSRVLHDESLRALHDENLQDLHAWAEHFHAPRFPLNGQDVMALGYPAGPDIGRILGAVEDWWMETGFTAGRGACLQKLKDDYARR